MSLRRVRATSRDAARMREFFDQYPSFKYNQSRPMISEFHRMCWQFKWFKKNKSSEKDEKGISTTENETDEKPKSSEKDKAHKAFKIALTQQFNDYYGTKNGNILAWQNLCRRLEVKPIPKELQACRDVSRHPHRLFYRGTNKLLDCPKNPCESS